MLKRFFGSRRKGDNSNASQKQELPSVNWPTALQRVEAARRAQNNGTIVMATRSSPASQTIMMFCPLRGKELLQRHEDCRRRDDDDEPDIEHEEQKEEENETFAPRRTSSTVLLHKPTKPNQLLAHALTNTNGTAWRRQRPLVQRALGDSSVVKKIAVPAAVKAAVELILSDVRLQGENYIQSNKAATNTSSSQEMVSVSVEVRSFSLQVAVATLIASVFGTITNTELKHQLEMGIRDLFHPTLLPVRGNAEKAAALDQPVKKVVDEIAATMMAAAESFDSRRHDPCLARNLLEQGHDIFKKSITDRASSKTTPLLSPQEVIGNCHSALLAGTQTIATTLAGAMLHLAEFKSTTSNCSFTSSSSCSKEDRAWFRAVVNETLRILPPVASLPRCPLNGDLHITSSSSSSSSCPIDHASYVAPGGSSVDDASSTVITLREGGVLLLDVLSMAHCPSTNSSANDDDNDNTWKFCPIHDRQEQEQKQQDRSGPRPYPWGFGDRICPAGNLSVSCISSVLEALMVEERWSWQLADPGVDSVGSFGTNGWVASVTYQPTLSYPKPLWLSLSRKAR